MAEQQQLSLTFANALNLSDSLHQLPALSPQVDFITKLFERNLTAVVEQIFSNLSGSDVLNVFLAIDETSTILNRIDWCITKKIKNSSTFTALFGGKKSMLTEERRNCAKLAMLNDGQLENLARLMARADYIQLGKNSSLNDATDGGCETFTLSTDDQDSPVSWVVNSMVVNEHVLALGRSCWRQKKIIQVMLYDRHTFHPLDSIVIKNDFFDKMFLPNGNSSKIQSVVIYHYQRPNGGERQFFVTLWNAFGTGRARTCELNKDSICKDIQGYRTFRTADIYIYMYKRFYRVGSCDHVMHEAIVYKIKNMENELAVEKLPTYEILHYDDTALDDDGIEASEVAIINGDEYFAVFFRKYQPHWSTHVLLLDWYEVRSKSDFSLVKLIQIPCGSGLKESRSPIGIGTGSKMFDDASGDGGGWETFNVLYVLGDKFLIVEKYNERLKKSSIQVRSLDKIDQVVYTIVDPLNHHQAQKLLSCFTVNNGYLLADEFETDNVVIWRLPSVDDLMLGLQQHKDSDDEVSRGAVTCKSSSLSSRCVIKETGSCDQYRLFIDRYGVIYRYGKGNYPRFNDVFLLISTI